MTIRAAIYTRTSPDCLLSESADAVLTTIAAERDGRRIRLHRRRRQ